MCNKWNGFKLGKDYPVEYEWKSNEIALEIKRAKRKDKTEDIWKFGRVPNI